jgi:outer membrane protein assembly factor BamD
MEIVHPSANSPAPTSTVFPGTQPTPAAAVSTSTATTATQPGGIGPVGPANATPLPPVEKPAEAAAAINEAAGTKQPPAQLASVDGKKKPKSDFDKADESSSKHKKKKGLAKLNPF